MSSVAGGYSTAIGIFNAVTAIVSVVVSFLVVLTGIVFRSMLRSAFFRTIFSIAFCDIFISFLYSFGSVPNHTTICTVQGFVGSLFLRSSVFYTVGLTVQLYCIVLQERTMLIFSEQWMHIVIWFVSIFLNCIPYAGNVYPGTDDATSGISPCLIEADDGVAPTTYITFYYYLPFLGSFFILLCLSLRLRCYISFGVGLGGDIENTTSRKRVETLVFATQLYPLALLVTWIPNVISTIYDIGLPRGGVTVFQADVNGITNAIGTLYGALLGTIFFANSREARQRWRLLLQVPCQSWCCCRPAHSQPNMDIEMDEDLESIISISRLSTASNRSRQNSRSHSHSDSSRSNSFRGSMTAATGVQGPMHEPDEL